ncbi:MAG TPA: DUF448 domain-containing protein [Helicobacter sp.]|uniref:DUF448 domain-containing protein n=2 Tax=Helicobacter typhlonius TaxID=76936 RepID=A0A4U8RYD8_9HELI|nr:DUF448 domain-containing protein [Helicobacter typhlonius]TLD87627.1 DUF448 domain-containing protein [Helicobacter sp. MIT 03-1616]HCD73752.1 DUF448 domain-containing protein [Helicobacter sp.]
MRMPKQTRMCIKCRGRFQQKELLRLQNINYSLCEFSGKGRSFYVCEECLAQPKTFQIVIKMNKLQVNEEQIEHIKEIWNLWKK